MVRKFGSHKVYVAVITHKRPENMAHMQALIGDFTAHVNAGQDMVYKGYHDNVVSYGNDICEARNKAIEKAGALPCIQVSDDLKKITMVSMDRGGKRVVFPTTFSQLVSDMVTQLKVSRYYYGGVAVTDNRMNYQGKPYSFDKLLVNDLICVMPKPGRPLKFEIPLKEDYDMTIRQLLDVGGVVRCEQYLCHFPHRENVGGANTYRNDSTEGKATQRLKAKWGPLILDHKTRPGQVSLNYKLIREKREEIIKLAGGGH